MQFKEQEIMNNEINYDNEQDKEKGVFLVKN